MKHRPRERRIVFGEHVMNAAEIRCHARLEPARTHGIGAIFGFVEVDHRTVPREGQLRGNRLCPFDRNFLGARRKFFPLVRVFVFLRIGWIQFVDVQIFLIDRENGETKSNRSVVSNGNAR